MRPQPLGATIALVVLVAAPLAFAQTAKPKKKGAAPAPSASDTAVAPAPAPDPAPAAAATADVSVGAKASVTTTADAADVPNTPPPGAWDATDTRQDPTKPYYFLGLRYRGTIIPKFLVNLFVNDGGTFYSNTVGAELDIRKDSHSTIPWVTYTTLSFGDTLFFQKGVADEPYNYSDVSSGLGMLTFGLDELWSVPLDEKHHWDFEYGFGVGLGVVFGTLHNDWVYQTNNTGTPIGNLVDDQGRHYAQCATQALGPNAANVAGNDCSTAGHSNSKVAKVGNYAEPNWFGGGSIPVIFPQIYFPSLGIRYEPVKNFEARLGLGFSLTGFYFGISGNYGFEKPQAEETTPAAPKKDTGSLRPHGMM
ncbi:MAG TPA: hypothetical protein VGG39_02365 [Polyangiaceae bacterium]|jgi:hypothetical protein